MQELLLTPREAGELLGRDPRTIRKWVREVPELGFEIAGRIFVRRHVVERLLYGGLKQTAPSPRKPSAA